VPVWRMTWSTFLDLEYNLYEIEFLRVKYFPIQKLIDNKKSKSKESLLLASGTKHCFYSLVYSN
jgi:hypothetical protein